MTDPKRWCEEGSEADDPMRDLVLAGQARRLPDAERRAIWAGLALALPTTPPVTDLGASTTASATGSTTLGSYFAKGLLFLATLGGLGVGAVQLWPHADEKPTPKVATPTVPAVTAVPAAREPEPSAIAAPVSTAVAPPEVAKARSTPETQLREESMAVLEARAALRSGNAGRSLALLDRARTRFPRGALGQEREALTIEALAKTGQKAAARRRAEAFLRLHPSSPYVADVRRVAEL